VLRSVVADAIGTNNCLMLMVISITVICTAKIITLLIRSRLLGVNRFPPVKIIPVNVNVCIPPLVRVYLSHRSLSRQAPNAQRPTRGEMIVDKLAHWIVIVVAAHRLIRFVRGKQRRWHVARRISIGESYSCYS